MSTVQRNKGKCDVCGEEKKIHTVYGKKTCTTCEVLLARIRRYPQMVVTQLRAIAPEALGGERSADQADFDKLRGDLAAAEEQREKLWTALENIGKALRADDDEDLVEVASRRMNIIARLETSYQNESVALSHAEAERDDLRRQLEGAIVPEVCGRALDRPALTDLVIRLAIGTMRGEIEGIDADDIELLRSI